MSDWIHSDLFVLVVSWVGTVSAVALFASPAFTFWNIVRERNVSKFDPTPYLISLLQCLLWDTYCVVTPGRVMPLVTNVCGAGLELIWCAIFFAFTPKKFRFIVQFVGVVIVWGAATLGDTLGVPHLHWKPLKPGDTMETDMLGVLCVAINICMYAAPLVIVTQVIKTRSVQYMPLSLTVCQLINSCCWGLYGILKNDVWVLIPNAAGIVLGVIQLIIYAIYCRCAKVSDSDGPARNVLISAGDA